MYDKGVQSTLSSGNFTYYRTFVSNGELDIDEIGECCLLGRTDLGEEYYLLVTTYMGQTEIIEYGPIIPDLDALPKSLSYNYDRFDYSEFKIEKRIDKFLNKNVITQAECINKEELPGLIKSPIEYLRRF